MTIIIIVALAAACYWWRDDLAPLIARDSTTSPAPADADTSTVKVITQPVVLSRNDTVFEAVGTGRARLSIRIYPAVSEEVTEILFEGGQKVSKGDVLVRLDDREELLAVKLAEVKLRDSESLLERYEQAVQQGGVPQSEVDSARAAFEGAGVALEQARLDLEERRIKAPFDGVMGIPRVDPGDRISPDTVIASLDDRDILLVDFEIPEALAGALRGGENRTVTAATPAYPGRTFSGTVTAQESRVDPERRTLMVRASIENSEDLLRPGMSFTTVWEVKGREYPAVAEISLQWGRDGSFVWIVRDGAAEKVPVRVVARSAGRVLLDADIEAGEQVVIEGVQRLRPGVPVEILGEASPGGAAQ